MSKGIKTDAHAGATGAAAPEVRAPRGNLRVDARKRLPVAGRDDPVGSVHGREGEHLTSGLFAAYPNAPLPTQLPARAYRLITLLRELRGCVHINACAVHGISGLEATLLAQGGEFRAKLHGWQPPYENVEHLRPNRDAAEKSTNDAMARLIDMHLSPSEMNQLAEQTTRITSSL